MPKHCEGKKINSTLDTGLFYREMTVHYRTLQEIGAYLPVFHAATFFHGKEKFLYHEHRHENYEIIIPDNTDYSCRLNGERLHLKVGDFLVIQPGDIHQDDIIEGQKFSSIVFDLELHHPSLKSRRIFREKVGVQFQIGRLEDSGRLAEIMELFIKFSRDGEASYFVLNGLCQGVFWELVRVFSPDILVPFMIQNTEQEQFRKKLYALFESHIRTQLSLTDMAGHFNYSRRSFIRHCNEILNMSPVKAFTEYRMRLIEKYVRCSNLPFKEISEMFGFENQFHFSTQFKKHFKISPTLFRRDQPSNQEVKRAYA